MSARSALRTFGNFALSSSASNAVRSGEQISAAPRHWKNTAGFAGNAAGGAGVACVTGAAATAATVAPPPPSTDRPEPDVAPPLPAGNGRSAVGDGRPRPAASGA